MTRLWLALILLVLPLAVWAQEGDTEAGEEAAEDTVAEEAAADETTAEEPGAEQPAETITYSTYVARGFGFAVDLPDSGSVENAESEGWDEDTEVAFNWYGAEGDPVLLIQARMDSIGGEEAIEIDAEAFGVFCDTLLESWTEDPERYTVVKGNEPLTIREVPWNMIEVEDRSDADVTVYYSVFSTYSGTSIYTISLYYLVPVNDAIQDFGGPVLASFALTGD